MEGERFTFDPSGGSLSIRRGLNGILVAGLDQSAFSDLVEDAVSTFGLTMLGRADVRVGSVDAFVAWEPVLRFLFDGRAVYEPDTIRFHDRDGAPLELRRSFTLDEDPDEMGHFLAQAGFLHIESVFSEAEMDAVSRGLDNAIERPKATMVPRGGRKPKPENGTQHESGVQSESRRPSETRCTATGFPSIGTLTDDEYVQRDPDVGDSAEGLLKKVHVIEGISDVSWHKDCAMGGHSRHCCGLTVGISVTGAGPENGELGVVPGSHRANIALLGIEGLDLPRLPLPTRTGDITVHAHAHFI